MNSLIRVRARKDDGSVELTIGFSKAFLVTMIVLSLGLISLGYGVVPAESQAKKSGKKAINPNQVYSEAVEAGDFVFLSGKIAYRQGKVVPGGVKAETKYVLDNLKIALAKSGLEMDDVVRTTVYLKTLEDYAGMNEVYQTYWENDPPARTTVEAGVVLNTSIEIDIIAYRGQ